MKRSEVLQQRKKLLKLIERWTRIEVGLRTGFFSFDIKFPKGGLSLANDMSDMVDEIREIVFGTSDIFELANKFGFKLSKRNDK